MALGADVGAGAGETAGDMDALGLLAGIRTQKWTAGVADGGG